MDAQGRVLIPQKLRELAKVTGDVEVLGSQTLLEVVNNEVFNSLLTNEAGGVGLTDDDLDAFSAKTQPNEK
jgi:MraZ protein